MNHVIEIGVPVEELERRRERVNRAKHFKEPDRVPVIPALAHRFLVPRVGVKFQDYYNNPEIMLHTQILAQKWLMENIRTDAYSITGAWVGAWTDFQNTFEAGSLGCEIIFPENDIPWVGEGWVRDEKDLQKLEQCLVSALSADVFADVHTPEDEEEIPADEVDDGDAEDDAAADTEDWPAEEEYNADVAGNRKATEHL